MSDLWSEIGTCEDCKYTEECWHQIECMKWEPKDDCDPRIAKIHKITTETLQKLDDLLEDK